MLNNAVGFNGMMLVDSLVANAAFLAVRLQSRSDADAEPQRKESDPEADALPNETGQDTPVQVHHQERVAELREVSKKRRDFCRSMRGH